MSNSISSISVSHIGQLQSPSPLLSPLFSSNMLPLAITNSIDLAATPTPQHCLQINRSTPSTSSFASIYSPTLHRGQG